ncbi:MAG TPA: hypothetical protein VFE47_24505 [Tepidisphaeraceae bacterium]|jgi:hypothetical protein|nr:hypothetical protein [Tepidisphaeraceae bacterium]
MIAGNIQVWVATSPVDLRKSFDALWERYHERQQRAEWLLLAAAGWAAVSTALALCRGYWDRARRDSTGRVGSDA